MKKTLCSALIFIFVHSYAQVGIGTTNPQATLDVRISNPASPSADAGIAITQVSVLPSSGNRSGQMVYLTTTNLYYFFNGVTWQPFYTQIYTLGDVKYGYQIADHSQWIKLDGRLKTTLTLSQQAAATTLGIGANLPNMSDKTIVGVSGTKALNSTGGNCTTAIAQNQLPNATLTTSSNGAHTHNAGISTTYLLSLVGLSGYPILNASTNSTPTTSSGDHTHTTSSINGGVTQQNLDIQNPYIALCGFIYLGV